MIQLIDHINLVVKDIDVSCRFYGETLGLKESFRKILEGDWVDEVTGIGGVCADCVFYEFPGGATRIELLHFRSGRGGASEMNELPNTLGVRHLAFLVEDLDAFVKHLRDRGVHVYSDPVRVPFPVGKEGRTKRLCYFRDPDGVLLEVAEYEG
jgi:catechol 2,3-dioxygenase-like lactoylglutathione lyase family enzyme